MDESKRSVSPEEDFVLKTIKNRDVHFIRCWFTDMLGNMKSFAVVPGELENAFIEGMSFDGSCIEGFLPTQDSDMLAFPDAATFQVLPWRPESNAVARMFCTIKKPGGQDFNDPRHILEKAIEHAEQMGFTPNVGSQLEFFYFKDDKHPEVLDHGSSFDLTPLDYASDMRRDTVLTLEKMGIPVEFSHHEKGPSQHEIDLRYTDALAMADSIMTYKLIVKEIAMKHGIFASFMPKPLTDAPGSGMHLHLSLFDEDGRNAFYDANDPMNYELSDIAKNFIAGILAHAKEICLVTNQYVNSYKRLASGQNAPDCIAWARHNRSTMIRIPGYRPDDSDSCRIELRNPDPTANPYLAIALMLEAGLEGIEQKLELAPPDEKHNFFDMSPKDVRELGYETLPHDLEEAIEVFEQSDFILRVLGKEAMGYLTRAKTKEWDDYKRFVSPWELDRYLAVL